MKKLEGSKRSLSQTTERSGTPVSSPQQQHGARRQRAGGRFELRVCLEGPAVYAIAAATAAVLAALARSLIS
jgi:hypothetical protein